MPGAYLFTNLIDSNATITPSSEDSAYPVENIYDKLAAKVFRSESPTSLTILIDFGVARQADTIVIINHNLTSGATLSLKADGSNPPTTEIATPSYRENDLWKAFNATSARYWLLMITDSNASDIQIGQIIIGTRVALPRARRIGGYSPAKERFVISSETYAGVNWNYHIFQRQRFNPIFRILASELAIFTALDALIYGNTYPFIYIPDASAVDCYYVRKEESYEPQEIDVSSEIVYDYQMTLVEESRGLEILS